ncbi:MAG: hypothetical protein KGJ86_15600 [Chloroflexota bacterium]|nr:hypothetical protein [Chloroflexota bacterium]
MPNKLVRWLALGIGAIAIFWLGYSVGRVQNLSTLASLYRDADVARYTLTRAGITVHYEKAGGDGKPYIETADGLQLLDLSDWDPASRITVDGSSYDLVRIYPTSAVDYQRYRVAETLQGDGWQLEREITLAPDGSVEIDHTFVARRPIKRVDLSLAHVHSYFVSLDVTGERVEATVNRLTRGQQESGQKATATYKLTISPQGSPAPHYRPGDAGIFGPTSSIAEYTASNPAQDQRTELGKEVVKVEKLQ